MPENTVYVGRPTQWGNPYKIGQLGPCETEEDGDKPLTREETIKAFKFSILPDLDLEPLRGKDLACWCPLDLPCHADTILEALSVKVC